MLIFKSTVLQLVKYKIIYYIYKYSLNIRKIILINRNKLIFYLKKN